LDEAVVRKMITHIGAEVGTIYVKSGKTQLIPKIGGYNKAAELSPWLVLLDLDNDAGCAPEYRDRILPQRAPRMCFRVAVRAIEAWLLADRSRISAFLHVREGVVPRQPEILNNPKKALIELAAESEDRTIREHLIPRPGSGRSEGPAYASRLMEFILDPKEGWRPEVATKLAPSLKSALECLKRFKPKTKRRLS
jgi:hypothetical protein